MELRERHLGLNLDWPANGFGNLASLFASMRVMTSSVEGGSHFPGDVLVNLWCILGA